MKSILLATVTVSTFAMPALAAPKVAVDILPVHSLVSRVMEGVATPTLVVPPGASPHGYAMRPSEAAALQDADVVFFIGEALSPQIARSIESLAGDATRISLLEVPDIVRLEFREGATFEAHDHSAHGDDHDDHDHGEHASHDDHDHEAEKAHDDHGEHEHASHDDHDHAAEKAHDDHGEHEHASHDDHDHAAEKAHDDHG
ncbi:MAG: zinc ABC transporter substrate-binding protein, partial [Pseudomonadota bacterium]